MNLYEIDDELTKAFEAAVDPEAGLILDEEMFERFNELAMARDTKVENIALYIKNLTAEAEALRTEKQNFDRRLKATENRVNSLTKYLSGFLNGEKFKTDKCMVNFRKSQSVELSEGYSVYDIDTHYVRAQEPKLDKVAIANALKNGEKIDGVYLKDNMTMSVR